MQRYAFKMFLNPGEGHEYRRRHEAIWPELAALIREKGVRNYSIHLDPRPTPVRLSRTDGGSPHGRADEAPYDAALVGLQEYNCRIKNWFCYYCGRGYVARLFNV